jgi:Zn-dependent M28 family amino/carboxypeptidase
MPLRTILSCCTALWVTATWASPIPFIQGVVDEVSATQYEAYQLAIESMGLGLYDAACDMGVRNREGWAGPGTLGNQEARLYLIDRFTDMGLAVTTQGAYRNVVAELPGRVTPDEIYIICGHYDHVGGETGDRPGGDDNASGTAGVLEAARVLSRYAFAATLRFIGFNAEEDGLWGSADYVENVVIAAAENVRGVINLDMILRPAWDNDPAEPEDLDLATGSAAACQEWANAFISAAADYAPSLAIDPSSPYVGGASDHWPFVNAGFPAFLAIENAATEIWGGANAYYHTAEDASDRAAGAAYDYAFAADVIRAASGFLALEAAIIVPEPASLAVLLICGAVCLGWRRRP